MRYFQILLFSIAILVLTSFQSKDNFSNNYSGYSNNGELEKYKKIFNDLNEFLKEENGALWNHKLYGALILVEPNQRVAIANESDPKGILTKKEGLYIGQLPKELNIANTAITWEGKRWTMVMLPLPEDKYERQCLFVHELFHGIQPKIGFDSLYTIPCNHLDEVQGRIYLKLEFEALKKAIQSSEIEKRTKHVKNALLFRYYRYQLYPEAKKAENSLELMEGLAEYTGSILSGRSNEELESHYLKSIQRFYENASFIRSFAYHTIPVYGYFLRREDSEWTKSVNKGTVLCDFISTKLGFEVPPDIQQEVKNKSEQYGGEIITIYETKRDEIKRKVKAELIQKIDENPTLILPFSKMSFSFNPSTVMPLDNIGTYYPNMRVSDSWGILTVENGAVMGNNWSRVILSEPLDISDKLVKGDGWKLELNPGWKVIKKNKKYVLKN